MPQLDLKESQHSKIVDRLIEAINSTEDIIDIFDESSKQLIQAIKCDYVNILLNNEKARYFCIIHALNQSSPEMGEEIIIPYNETSITEIIHSRRSVVRPDLSGRGELTPGDLKFLADGIKSDLSVPIICRSRIFAIINLSSYESNFFSEHHQDQTEQIASLLGLVLERSELVEKLNRKQSDLLFWKNKFNCLYNNINEPVAIIRLDYDLIYETNLAFQKLTGYTADELQGMRLTQLHPDEEKLILSDLDKCCSGEKELEPGRLKLNRKDGLQVPVKLKFISIGGDIVKFAFALYEENVKPRSWQTDSADGNYDLIRLQLAVFNKINHLATAGLEPGTFIRSALLAIKEAVDFDYAQVALFDNSNNHVENHTIISDRCRQLDDQENWNILEDCDFYWYKTDLKKLKSESGVGENSYENIERALQSRASGVLMTKSRQPGTLILGSLEPNFYQKQQHEFIKQVAEHIAIIIDNAILFKEHKTRMFQSSVQRELNERIGTNLGLENVLLNIVKLSAEKMGAQLSTIQLIENSNLMSGIIMSDPNRDKRVFAKFEKDNIFPKLKNSKQPYLIYTISNDDLTLEHIQLSEFVSCQAIPLKFNKKIIGILSNYWKKPYQSNSDDLSLPDAIAAQAAATIENARAFQATITYSNRLEEAKDELEHFVETISCNMKNPLAAIQGLSSTILDKLKDEVNDEALSCLERIRNKAVTLQRYIDDLNEFASVGQAVHPFKQVEANTIIERAMSNFIDTINERKIKVVVTKNLPAIHCDRNLMQQVFVNLIENAITELAAGNAKPKIEVGYREQTDNEIFYVRNNSNGITKLHHENIFDLFHHGDAAEDEQKCGKIGLAIAKKIIEIHDGQIWYESKEAKGSTIFISLPRRRFYAQPGA